LSSAFLQKYLHFGCCARRWVLYRIKTSVFIVFFVYEILGLNNISCDFQCTTLSDFGGWPRLSIRRHSRSCRQSRWKFVQCAYE